MVTGSSSSLQIVSCTLEITLFVKCLLVTRNICCIGPANEHGSPHNKRLALISYIWSTISSLTHICAAPVLHYCEMNSPAKNVVYFTVSIFSHSKNGCGCRKILFRKLIGICYSKMLFSCFFSSLRLQSAWREAGIINGGDEGYPIEIIEYNRFYTSFCYQLHAGKNSSVINAHL